MRSIFTILLLIFILIGTLIAEDNIFNSYLLHQENFKIKYYNLPVSIIGNNIISKKINLKIQNKKRNIFENDKLHKYFDIKSETISPNIKINIPKSLSLKIGYNDESSEFIPVAKNQERFFKRGYNFDLQQYLGYNIASKFSYFYQKDYFQKIKEFNITEKGYKINITKFFNNNKFDFLYQYIDTDVGGDNENIYMLQDEKSQKFSFSYEVSFDKKFSLVLLYSLEQNVKEDERAQNNYLYTGFRYIFDLNQK
jgi:hypothetical protein